MERMTDFENEAQRAYTLLGRLEMVSHGTVMRIAGEPTGRSERVKPPGGIGGWEDRLAVEEESELLTHEHFRPLLRACRTPTQYATVAEAIEKALRAWKRAKAPQRDTRAWRESIGKEMATRDRRRGSGSADAIAEKWRVSKKSAYQYEQEYTRKHGVAA